MRTLKIRNAVFVENGETVSYFKGDEVPEKHIKLVGGETALEPLPGQEPEEDSPDQPAPAPKAIVPPSGDGGQEPPPMKELRERAKPFGLKFGVGTSRVDALAQVEKAEAYAKSGKDTLQADLDARVASGREVPVEGTGADGAVLVGDIVKALLADDAEQQG